MLSAHIPCKCYGLTYLGENVVREKEYRSAIVGRVYRLDAQSQSQYDRRSSCVRLG